MAQATGLPAKSEIPPAKWQLTSYCFWCDLAKNLAVIMVYGDWRANCIHYERYHALKSQKERAKMLNDCPGPSCHYVGDYRDKLIQEHLSSKPSK